MCLNPGLDAVIPGGGRTSKTLSFSNPMMERSAIVGPDAHRDGMTFGDGQHCRLLFTIFDGELPVY